MSAQAGTMASQVERAREFEALHEAPGAFVIPNPYDPGSAVMLAQLGFKALATTSSGYAQTLGRLDGEISLDEKLEHCRALCASVSIPVSADLEHCYDDTPAGAAANLLRFAGTGLAGGSIEDYSRDGQIYPFELAVERVQAAVEAVRTLDFPFVLTARAEGLLRRANTMEEVIERLQAFEAAGADVLYAPGLTTLEDVRTVTSAVGKPVNVLAGGLPDATVTELAEAGAKRISVGGALGRLVAAALAEAAREMRDEGGFSWLGRCASGRELLGYLGR
ncbi:MAG: isocitrate lyase/phosphoenolpyruvate mutase family protein [Pseudomonadota bacterium]